MILEYHENGWSSIQFIWSLQFCFVRAQVPSLLGSFLTELYLHYIYTHRDSLKFKFNILGNFHSFVVLLYSSNIFQQKFGGVSTATREFIYFVKCRFCLYVCINCIASSKDELCQLSSKWYGAVCSSVLAPTRTYLARFGRSTSAF